MAHRKLIVSPLLTFNFVSTGRSTDDQVVALGPRAVAAGWAVSGVVIATLTAVTLASGATITIGLNNVNIIPENPLTTYVGSALASVVASSTTTPAVNVTQFTTPIGSMFQATMTYNGGTTAAGTMASITCKIEVILRDA